MKKLGKYQKKKEGWNYSSGQEMEHAHIDKVY